MTRESILEDILAMSGKSFLFTLSTGVGKTKIAIEKSIQLCNNLQKPILIIAPKLSIIEGWKEEFIKWGYEEWLGCCTFTTYASLHKHADTPWEVVIADEAHHISERVADIMALMTMNSFIALSATVNREIKWRIKALRHDISMYDVQLRKAIDEDILPDPTVYLIPLKLTEVEGLHSMIVHPKAKNTDSRTFALNASNYWNIVRTGMKNTQYILTGNAVQYHTTLSSIINTYKNKSYNEIMKNRWLQACGERLKWLARLKNDKVNLLLSKLKNYRTLTFCCDIQQTKDLSGYSINSKDKDSLEVLEKFNKKKIKHISSVGILNEGVNLVDCKITIFANLNSSETYIKQRGGRSLRHKSPIIIIPYFVDTREEEIVKMMLENYNMDLVHVVEDLESFEIKEPLITK